MKTNVNSEKKCRKMNVMEDISISRKDSFSKVEGSELAGGEVGSLVQYDNDY